MSPSYVSLQPLLILSSTTAQSGGTYHLLFQDWSILLWFPRRVSQTIVYQACLYWALTRIEPQNILNSPLQSVLCVRSSSSAPRKGLHDQVISSIICHWCHELVVSETGRLEICMAAAPAGRAGTSPRLKSRETRRLSGPVNKAYSLDNTMFCHFLINALNSSQFLRSLLAVSE